MTQHHGLTLQEVQDGHVYEIHQSGASVVRRSLFHSIAVCWGLFPSEKCGHPITETLTLHCTADIFIVRYKPLNCRLIQLLIIGL